MREVEDIFEQKLGVDFHCVKFNKISGWKVVSLLLGFLISEAPMLFFLITNGLKAFTHICCAFVLKTIFRMFLIKYTFYADVVRVCLKNIEMKLAQRDTIRKGDVKLLRKAYTLCWHMSSMIEDIFGWGIACTMLVILGASTLYGYIMCYDYAKENMNFAPMIPFLCDIVVIWIMATSCKKCADSSVTIASLTFSINSSLLHEIVTDFALQVMHQKIKFEPKTFFVVNHKLIVGVSINLLQTIMFIVRTNL